MERFHAKFEFLASLQNLEDLVKSVSIVHVHNLLELSTECTLEITLTLYSSLNTYFASFYCVPDTTLDIEH